MVMPETKQESPVFLKSLNEFVRENHETFWLATRFLGNQHRIRALRLLALDGEFYRVKQMASENMVALIRLQWWRDEIDKVQNGTDSQPTLAGQALGGLLATNPQDAHHVLALIDAYDDLLTGQGNNHAEVLFAGLFDLKEPDNSLAQTAGKVFRAAHEGRVSGVFLERLAEAVSANTSESVWVWLCLFGFLPEWKTKKPLSAFGKRWRIWKTFLGGEKRLAGRLRKFAAES